MHRLTGYWTDNLHRWSRLMDGSMALRLNSNSHVWLKMVARACGHYQTFFRSPRMTVTAKTLSLSEGTIGFPISRVSHAPKHFKGYWRKFFSLPSCSPSLVATAAPMADDSSKDELFQLIKRLGAYLTLKISSLDPLNHRNSRSLWALVGLVTAIIFMWKILRAPSGSQRRQQKRQVAAPGVSGVHLQSNAVTSSSGHFSSSEHSRTPDMIDELFQSVKPTLAQIVRQRLRDGRKVTCQLLGVILEESSPEELQMHATVRSSVLEVLSEITKFCDLYLMERILDDGSEDKIISALDNAGLFTSGALVKDKVLFCSTENGRSSFVRQLEPDWHIDTNPEVISQLSPEADDALSPTSYINVFKKLSNNLLRTRLGNMKVGSAGPLSLCQQNMDQ
ncbi:hypothetical protein ACLOJK_039607 [Asimina triloba]